RYSFQKPNSDAPTVNISGEEVWLDTKRIRLRRRLPSAKRRLRPAGLYVRSHQKVSGEVGSVIVIFDEDHEERYNYCTTWLGEHQNESDMAFYSTFPFDNMVGPGIGRGEYGGFLMSLPARRMFDVWKDPDYDMAESKSERLLLAGLDYSIWKFVVYVATKPPRSIFRNIATRFGR